jgi:uncharacterized membrane protein
MDKTSREKETYIYDITFLLGILKKLRTSCTSKNQAYERNVRTNDPDNTKNCNTCAKNVRGKDTEVFWIIKATVGSCTKKCPNNNVTPPAIKAHNAPL